MTTKSLTPKIIKPKTMTGLNKILLINLMLLTIALIFIVWIVYHQVSVEILENSSPAKQEALKSLILFDNWLPRFVMAFLVGGSLGLCTIILQQVTYNPLASDSTLAVNGGAYIALLLVTLFSPSLLTWLSGSLIALIGALFSLAIVFALSYRNQFLPIRMLLSGLVLNLYFGALATALVIFHPEAAKNIFSWQSGSLIQDSWSDVLQMLVVSLIAYIAIMFLLRSLHIMQLGDVQAKSLGVSVGMVRMLCILVVAYLCGTTLSLVGMIGFIGLAAATMINQLNITRMWHKVLFAYTTAGLLLLLTDTGLAIAQIYSSLYLPVGTVSAFIGAPLLLYLIFKALPKTIDLSSNNKVNRHLGDSESRLMVIAVITVMIGALLLWLSLTVSQSPTGFIWTGWHDVLITIKLPRIITAIACGIMLSVCGVLLQRMTHNPLASPDLLGISSGAAISVIITVMLLDDHTIPLWIPGLIGAFITFLSIIFINIKNSFQPEKVILTGISIAALLTALIQLCLVNGDGRIQYLLVWLSGSTYSSELGMAKMMLLASIIMLLLTMVFARAITMLLLPTGMSRLLGLHINAVRLGLIIMSTLLITLSTLQIGPLSFVGLLAPLITRTLGFYAIRMQLVMSALIGSSLMVAADWLGRNILFPYEIPTGIMATLIGGSFFFYLMRRM